MAHMLTKPCPSSKESHKQNLKYQQSSIEAESGKDGILWSVQRHIHYSMKMLGYLQLKGKFYKKLISEL